VPQLWNAVDMVMVALYLILYNIVHIIISYIYYEIMIIITTIIIIIIMI
jgi:hypothetical protein